MAKSPFTKHWWQSAAIKGALTAGAGALLSPVVLNVLPPKVAAAVTIVGTVASAIGLRRALP